MNLDFYALRDDICELVHFIYEETDARVFESYSRHDTELREFRSLEELSSAFELGIDPYGSGRATTLQLWFPSVTRDAKVKRINLKVKGHSFRYCIEGTGLVQLYLGGKHEGEITDSHLGHNNEAGARGRAPESAAAIDWGALRKVSRRIQRHIRNKLAVAKLYTRPVLPAAFSSLQARGCLRFNAQCFEANSPEIKLLQSKGAF